MTTESFILAAGLAAIVFYAAIRLRRELQMLQQNSYRPARYLRWLRGEWGDTERVTDLLTAGMLVGGYFTRWSLYVAGAVGLLALYKGVRGLRVRYKKPLVFTPRAVRLYGVGLLLAAAITGAAWWLWGLPWALAGALAGAIVAPAVIVAAVWILSPVEAAINRRYVADARRILRGMPRLVVIGITGSYGKTSTKHFLHRILSERFSTVMTPGSFNTTLGVVRTIREQLRPYTEVFIVEMGAKQRGDVAEICDLVQPTIGIVTAVGEQHLESFKTVENVRRAKFELVDALPPDGVAILNNDFPPIAGQAVTGVGTVVRYSGGSATGADYRLTDINYSRDGASFSISGPGGITEPFTTRLVGIHNLTNILAASIAARALGVTEAQMRHAIEAIAPVEHRLEIRHTPGGVTVIDDAFNSNPHGAAMALEVLAGFTGGRRIVVTPGMIELGERQRELNRELGRQMAAACDMAIVVGEHNRAAIVEGLAAGGFSTDKIYAAPTFDHAVAKVRQTARPGDTVLYENDLPDTFK